MREFKLESGAILKVAPATFAQSKALFQALMKELRSVPLGQNVDLIAAVKDLLCTGIFSKEVEAAMWVCFEKCTYNDGKGDLKIDEDTFEPVKARGDYLHVCFEVVKENVLPFGKSLYAEYKRLLAMIGQDPK